MALKVKWKDRWTLTPKNWNQFEFFHLLGQSNHLGQFTNFSTPTSLIVKHSSCLNGWFSRCGIQTRSIILTWELVSNANSQASPQMLGMRNFEHSSAFWQTLKGILKFENSWLKWSPSCFLIPTCHNSIYKHPVWGRWISNWGDCSRFEFFFFFLGLNSSSLIQQTLWPLLPEDRALTLALNMTVSLLITGSLWN